MKKRKLIPWSKKKESSKKHQHPQGPSKEAVATAIAILDVLYENGGAANIHAVADELLGPGGYDGTDAKVFDEAFAYARHYGALEVVTFCEHEEPAMVRMRAASPLLPLVDRNNVVQCLICIHCGLRDFEPDYDDDLPDVIVGFRERA